MLGDMMNQMNEMQEKMQKQLAEQSFTAEAGAVKVTCNGARQFTDISIDASKTDTNDPEELEDLLLVAINEALGKAAEYESGQAGGMMKDMLPPGLSGLFG
ncbi:nucleoid-associated protein, YbaB/EbfC family [Lewinellaceae bacterium SD302]|nr:nucleoid-associated protein, YbaB/EbfC family [Lewinellaceae bacterium SD302]